MTEVSDKDEQTVKMRVRWVFRFTPSDELVHLTERQLGLIPYLSTLVENKDNFSSIENANGEYVLNPPLEYLCFVAILRSITSQNPYKLFDELPSDENIFDALQLFDYLGLPPFPLAFLQGKRLVQRKSVPNPYRIDSITYHEATLPEACRTAAEFVFALANNEYELNDSNTRYAVFNLINIILFNAEVFSFRLRHHTLTIAKKRCYPFFSKDQKSQLETSYRLPQYKKMNSNKFNNSFSWRGIYESLAERIRKVERTVESSLRMFDSLITPLDHMSSVHIQNDNLVHDQLEEEIISNDDQREALNAELERDRKNEEA
jgi:hypothetical protein